MRVPIPPEATPATSDLACWLWAAFESRRGHLPTSRIAAELGVHPSTIRRWLRTRRPVTRELQGRLAELALERGQGTYQWPAPDQVTLFRTAGARQNAETACAAIEAGTYPETWSTNGTLEAHTVLEVRWPQANVRSVTVTRVAETERRILRRDAEILRAESVPHLYLGQRRKYEILDQATGRRCIAPRTLVLYGHTDCWIETDVDDDRDWSAITTATSHVLAQLGGTPPSQSENQRPHRRKH